MSREQLKESIHHLVDQIEDEDILKQYLELLEKSTFVETGDSTDPADDQLLERALASSHSIKAGKTRSLLDFKKDFELWKKQRAM